MKRESCHQGMKVVFGRGRGTKALAEVIKCNPKKARVVTLEQYNSHPKGTEFGVPYELLEAAPASASSAHDAPEATNAIANNVEQRRAMRQKAKRVTVGMKFRSHYADGNPEWTVLYKDGHNWVCKIEEDADWKGTEKVFMPREILQAINMGNLFAGLQQQHGEFYENLTPGQIVHYNNGFRAFVRCEVVRQDGENKLKPIAMVGEWSPHDLPQRRANGSIYWKHYPKMISERELFTPNASNIWENNNKIGDDPTGLEPVALGVPSMTEREQVTAAKWLKIEQLRKSLEGNDPDVILRNVRETIERPVVQTTTVV